MAYVDLDLTGFEWDVRQRTAEQIVRGDTPDARDLLWLAEGYLQLIEMIDAARDEIQFLENDLEDERTPAGLLNWRIDDTAPDCIIRVPVSTAIYDELLEGVREARAFDDKDADTSVAVAAFAALHRWTQLQQSVRQLASLTTPSA